MRFIKFLFVLVLVFSCSKDESSNPELQISGEAVPAEGGTVSPAQGTYSAGEEVVFTATPAEGYEFVSWDGDYKGEENPLQITASKSENIRAIFSEEAESIVIYTINDPHGKINNFAKIKAIIDKEKEKESQVFFVSGGDIFSGNPIVDYHPEKGSPIVDLMGKAGMDVTVIGNHEFDYGQKILNNRMDQASFDFLLANVSDQGAELNIPQGQVTIEKDGFKISFIGVVETGSQGNKPLSHPKNVQGLEFTEGVQAMSSFEDDEAVNNADLVVALTHYGSYGDRMILERHDWVDLVIGGHNHALYSEKVNGRYMVQSGSDLEYLTKLSLVVQGGEVKDYNREVISLNYYDTYDPIMQEEIAAYNNIPELFVEIGTSLRNHNSDETGCFYTDALRTMTGADLVFQNYGGIRAGLDGGPITPFDIYTIDPFGNGLETYTMTVAELKDFFTSRDFPSLSYSGLEISKTSGGVVIYDVEGLPLKDEDVLVVGMNDYISSVNAEYFKTPSRIFEKTTAEYIVDYLEQYQSVIDYGGCKRSLY